MATDAPRPKPQFLRPDEKLKRRALNFEKGLGLTLTEAEVEKIAAVVDNSRDEFISQVAAKLKTLRTALANLDGMDDERDMALLLDQIREDSYAVKGLGTTFGYPLLTYVAKSLNDYVERRRALNEEQAMVVGFHVNMLYAVLAGRITKVDPTKEAELLEAFQKLTDKFS